MEQVKQSKGKSRTESEKSMQEKPEASYSSEASSEPKSIGAIVAGSLAQESQEGVDRIISQVRSYFNIGKDYINENPREAAGLAVSIAVGTWAVLGTKPGRKAFEASSVVAIPRIVKWVKENFEGKTH